MCLRISGMPYIDGMGLSKYIHENLPQTTTIIFSGYSDFEYAKQAIQYKVAEYILKPVTAKELSEVLNRIREKLDGERQQEQKMDELTKVYQSYTKNEALIISRRCRVWSGGRRTWRQACVSWRSSASRSKGDLTGWRPLILMCIPICMRLTTT